MDEKAAMEHVAESVALTDYAAAQEVLYALRKMRPFFEPRKGYAPAADIDDATAVLRGLAERGLKIVKSPMSDPTATAATMSEKKALERVADVMSQWRRTPAMTNYGIAALVLDALRWPRSDGTVPDA